MRTKLATVLRDIGAAGISLERTAWRFQSLMSLRVSPYLLSLINWPDAYRDPIRRQCIPLASELEPDHPMSMLDSLGERSHSPVHGLIHRYPGKALFLALDTCPVYCRCCTRSYG
jgi:lysine 2,3-aminomutase